MSQLKETAAGVAAGIRPNSPTLHSEEHRSLIDASHRRSVDYGLRESDRPEYLSAPNGLMRTALEENRFLYQHAAPVMESLYQQIENTQSMVLLTERSGMILHSLGDSDFLEKAGQVALRPGVDWSERCRGTNAIGTALAEERPVVVHGAQHYLEANRFLTCSCTPIVDPFGKVIGTLDVTGDHRSYHQHTMALARMSAQMIENYMFADIFPNDLIVRFHARPEFLHTLMQGIAVFTPEGRFVAANRSAQFQLSLSVNALAAHTFSSLFGLAMSQFIDRQRQQTGRPVPLVLHSGVSVFCQTDYQTHRGGFGFLVRESARAPSSSLVDGPASSHSQRRDSLSSLHYLDTGDPQVHAVIQKLQRIRGHDISIMILGETGTGKELLARAVHNDSTRHSQPFVSVNCASIPETLIESELFGYEEGAFTGARRKGSQGKVLQASGGTLFLDEIGDMPRSLQARLLRVLQERRVTPLGSGKEVDVDIAVICATNRNLKDLIARGEFREDLYYRLNGLVVRLPALRDRQDLEVVTRKILASLSHSQPGLGIAPTVMELFRHYHWPGNFRQLFNLLQTAVVMAGSEPQIERDHLPEDFLEDVVESAPEQPDRPSATRSPPLAVAMVATASPTVVDSGQPTPTAGPGASMMYPAASAGVGAMPGSSPVQTGTAPVAATSAPPFPATSSPIRAAGTPTEAARLDHVALEAMAQALRACHGNVSVAAKMLGVSRNTIYRKKDLLPPDVWN